MKPLSATNSHALAFVLGLTLAGLLSGALAQTGPYNPSANFVSNQGYSAATITAATTYSLARAIYNGSATACNITVTMNSGASVQFLNVQPGEILPVQTTQVSATTCSASTLLAIQ